MKCCSVTLQGAIHACATLKFYCTFNYYSHRKRKKKQNISQSGYVLHMPSKFCLNSASTSLYNKKTNKQTNKKNKTKQNKTKKDKNDENEIQVSGGLLIASGISD